MAGPRGFARGHVQTLVKHEQEDDRASNDGKEEQSECCQWQCYNDAPEPLHHVCHTPTLYSRVAGAWLATGERDKEHREVPSTVARSMLHDQPGPSVQVRRAHGHDVGTCGQIPCGDDHRATR